MEKVENLLVTGQLTVKHPDASHGLTISATKDGAGLWIGNKTCVAVHNISGQCCLWVGLGDAGAHSFAISVDSQGEPSLQLARPGQEPAILAGENLQKLFDTFGGPAIAGSFGEISSGSDLRTSILKGIDAILESPWVLRWQYSNLDKRSLKAMRSYLQQADDNELNKLFSLYQKEV